MRAPNYMEFTCSLTRAMKQASATAKLSEDGSFLGDFYIGVD